MISIGRDQTSASTVSSETRAKALQEKTIRNSFGNNQSNQPLYRILHHARNQPISPFPIALRSTERAHFDRNRPLGLRIRPRLRATIRLEKRHDLFRESNRQRSRQLDLSNRAW